MVLPLFDRIERADHRSTNARKSFSRNTGSELQPEAEHHATHLTRFGGIGQAVTAQLQELTGKECRSIVLGHLLRGGSPTAMDRNLGVTFAAGAVYAFSKGMNGVMVALKPPRFDFIPLHEAVAELRLVPPDSEGVPVARTLDISFEDRPEDRRQDAVQFYH